MDNTQHTYFAELKLALQKAGYTVQAVEDGHLPIEWNDRRLCQVTESGGIRFRTDDTTDPAAEAARSRVTDIAGVVREYMTLIEQAPDLKVDGLGENYKLLTEFNGAVPAGHPSRYGVEFVTWEWSYCIAKRSNQLTERDRHGTPELRGHPMAVWCVPPNQYRRRPG